MADYLLSGIYFGLNNSIFYVCICWYIFSLPGLSQKGRAKGFFAWSAVIGLTCLVYYLFYLKPQLTPGLSAFHSPNIWLGKPLAWQLDFFWQHIITIFGFPANQVNNLKIIYPIVDTGAISFRASMPALTRFEPLVAFIIFACFTLGVASLWRRKQYSLPLAVVVAIISTLIFSALNIWPFGNNRANIFLLYGCYCCLARYLRNYFISIQKTNIMGGGIPSDYFSRWESVHSYGWICQEDFTPAW